MMSWPNSMRSLSFCNKDPFEPWKKLMVWSQLLLLLISKCHMGTGKENFNPGGTGIGIIFVQAWCDALQIAQIWHKVDVDMVWQFSSMTSDAIKTKVWIYACGLIPRLHWFLAICDEIKEACGLAIDAKRGKPSLIWLEGYEEHWIRHHQLMCLPHVIIWITLTQLGNILGKHLTDV